MKPDFERELQLWLDDEAPGEAPDWLLHSIVSATQASEPRSPRSSWMLRSWGWRAAAIGAVLGVTAMAFAAGIGVAGWLREVAAPPLPSPPAVQSPLASASAGVPPRPGGIPIDGTCEVDRQCLGLLATGTYRSEYFHPPLTFHIHQDGWENLRSSGGMVTLVPLDAPGDEILILEQATARTANNRLVPGIAHSADAFVRWIAPRDDLVVSDPAPVRLGGLAGQRMDITVRDGADNGIGGCPSRPCVALAHGIDPSEMPTWLWELSAWSGSAMRVYALDHQSTTVLVVVRAWNAAQLPQLLARVQPILDSLEFELPAAISTR